MASTVYTFVVKSGGDPTAATGLTPAFILYRDIESLTDLVPPAITEVGSGHYAFVVDWDTAPESTAPTDHIAIVIDAGASISSPNERFITARINRTDTFGTSVQNIETQLSTLDAKVDTINTTTNLLKEIETGKWEVVNNQLKIYQSDGVTLVKTFNLFDSTGAPTSTLPARREPV